MSVCGEMAGDPAFTELLLAMGLRCFSMHPSQIGAVKQRVLKTDTRLWSSYLERVLAAERPEEACLAAQAALKAGRSRAVPMPPPLPPVEGGLHSSRVGI